MGNTVTKAQARGHARTVDLKWSLWSCDKEHWEQYAPGAWDWMRQQFESGNRFFPLIIHTAPRKEIRFGEVRLYQGSANVHFWTEYDEGVRKEAPHLWATVSVKTFNELMHRIDHCELDLINEMRDKRRRVERCANCAYPIERRMGARS